MYILIEGRHPLYKYGGDNEDTFLEKLKRPKWVFNQKTSILAKDFFLKLCNTSAIERYTCDQALRHPWITRDFTSPIPMTQSEQIREFQQESALRKVMNLAYFMSIVKYYIKEENPESLEQKNEMSSYLSLCKKVVSAQESLASKDTTAGEEANQDD